MCVVIRRHPLPAENMTSAVRRQKKLGSALVILAPGGVAKLRVCALLSGVLPHR